MKKSSFIIIKYLFLLIILINASKIASGADPVLNTIPSPQNLTENIPFNLTINASDPEGGPLNFSDDTDNFNILKLNNTHAQIAFTPTDSMVGSFIAVIIVIDNENLVDAQAVNFTVNGVPDFQNLENKNITASLEFYYDINATDAEDGTNLTFSDNSTLFDINRTTGVINFTTNTSILGTYTINITVNDTKSANTTGTFDLVINDQPNITSIPGNITLEDQNFIINISDFLNNTVGTITFYDNATFFNIDSSTGLINITPVNNDTGNHSINITVQDTYGLRDTRIWSLNITPVNDAPTFPDLENQSTTVGRTFVLKINASDEENGTVNYFDNTTLFDINLTTGLINLTINSSVVGSYSINISVNDTSGGAYSDTFGLTIGINNAPIFGNNLTAILNPNADTHVHSTFPDTNYRGNEHLQLAAGTSIKRIYINFSINNISSIAIIKKAYLNLTVNTSSQDTGISVYRVTANWSDTNITYNNQPSIDANMLGNTTSAGNEMIDMFNITETVTGWFNNSLGRNGLSIRITDETQEVSSIKYYSTESSNSSKWPYLYVTYNQTIPDQSLIAGTNITNAFNLSAYFLDPDGNPLTYNVTNVSDVNASINADGSIDIFSSSGFSGQRSIVFNATDGINTTLSNTVIINVTSSGSTTTTTTTSASSSGGGSGSSSPKTAALSITVDKKREIIKEGEALGIPVELKNTGEIILNDIKLSIKADKPGLQFNINPSAVSLLSINQKETAVINIDSKEALEKSYIVTLTAAVTKPTLTESTVIVLDVLTEAAKIREQLDFAADFFKNNPECLELQELINKAETLLQQKHYQEASVNLNIAIESCKNLIREKEEPSKSKSRFSLLISTLIILAIATIVIISLYIGIRKLLPERGSNKRIRKKWF